MTHKKQSIPWGWLIAIPAATIGIGALVIVFRVIYAAGLIPIPSVSDSAAFSRALRPGAKQSDILALAVKLDATGGYYGDRGSLFTEDVAFGAQYCDERIAVYHLRFDEAHRLVSWKRSIEPTGC